MVIVGIFIGSAKIINIWWVAVAVMLRAIKTDVKLVICFFVIGERIAGTTNKAIIMPSLR